MADADDLCMDGGVALALEPWPVLEAWMI